MNRGGGGRVGAYRLQSREQKRRQGLLEDPIIGLVDEILFQGISVRASDIHIHAQPSGLSVRFRIDGVLQFFQDIIADHAQFVLARLKILANLDVGEARLPQDGKCVVTLHVGDLERTVDLRFATIPAVHGEKILVRILDTTHQVLTLSALGLAPDVEKNCARLMNLPYGLIITTGPTGAGKTTTLYALLSTINTQERQIVTLEDPVEYSFPGIVQVQVNPKIGFSFDQGLRAMLRQDPDVMMIGEMRDRPTAQIAMEAALTGHLVLSTLHTKDAVSSIVRLREMQIDSYLLTAALTAVVGQRIVRRLCEHCKVEDVPSPQELNFFAVRGQNIARLWRAKGCNRCFSTGYYGRIGIFELCIMSDALRHLIVQNASVATLRDQAQSEGLIPFIVDGLRKISLGIVSCDELLRILD